uniref:Uncharacterized protein n=1 Tax=Esox lucius TaxID=8010 RepID=A0A6Q2YNZ8_ESOLU
YIVVAKQNREKKSLSDDCLSPSPTTACPPVRRLPVPQSDDCLSPSPTTACPPSGDRLSPSPTTACPPVRRPPDPQSDDRLSSNLKKYIYTVPAAILCIWGSIRHNVTFLSHQTICREWRALSGSHAAS